MLILSHLHKDHVSGVEELFRRFRKVKDVFLPYLSPRERLLLAVLAHERAPGWYFTFLSDPVRYLLTRGVERIIFIGGEASEHGEGVPPPEEPSNPQETLEINLPDDEDLENEIRSQEPDWGEYIKSGKVLVKNHTGYARISVWYFRFFNYKTSQTIQKAFQTCLESISCAGDIKYCIVDREIRNKLKRCYKESGLSKGDINDTSLLVYHGSIGNKGTEVMKIFLMGYPYFCYHFVSRGGQLLTGDINLNHGYSEIINHFKHELKNIRVVGVPHHGAKRNWNSDILSDIGALLWVVSAGLCNRYGHPSLKVWKDVLSSGRYLIWSNEFSPVLLAQ